MDGRSVVVVVSLPERMRTSIEFGLLWPEDRCPILRPRRIDRSYFLIKTTCLRPLFPSYV
jgi:hypothetical protein